MKERVPEVKRGDPITADGENKLRRILQQYENESPPAGINSVDTEGVKGTAQQRVTFTMVRMTAIVVPTSSSLYLESLSHRPFGANSYNSVVQVWDDILKAWSDDPLGQGLEVAILDDQSGWKPLIAGDILPVMWHRSASVYVPYRDRETAILVPQGGPPDSDGMFLANRVVWSSENKSWTTLEACYVMDVG